METPMFCIFLNLFLIVSSHTVSEEPSSTSPFTFNRSTPITPWFYERFIKNRTFIRLNGLTLIVDVSNPTQFPSSVITTTTSTTTTTFTTTIPTTSTTTTSTTTISTTATTTTTTTTTSTTTPTTTTTCATTSFTTTTSTTTTSTTTTTTTEKTVQRLPIHLSHSAFENRAVKIDQMFEKIMTSLNVTQASLDRLSDRLERVTSVTCTMSIVIAICLTSLVVTVCGQKQSCNVKNYDIRRRSNSD